MIRVNINGEERNVNEIHHNWIHNTIRDRLEVGEPVCVVIRINQGDVNVSLSAGQCESRPGGKGIPNSHEEDVFSLWSRMKVSEVPVNSGKIVAFLEQLKRV